MRLCLGAPAFADTGLPAAVAAADVLAIIKGMVDAAGARGEVDEDALKARVERAVSGYLGPPAPADGRAIPLPTRGG